MIHTGDCTLILPTLAADSFDAIVCDPPYHLTTGKKGGTGTASLNPNSPAGRSRIGTGFMGKAWDGGDVAFRPETWAAVLRVAKPGAHLVAFGGTRTFHRLMCAIEDAGWEIRDTLMYLFGSGFPKSHNLDREKGRAFCGCKTSDDSMRGVRQGTGDASSVAQESNHPDLFSALQRETSGAGVGEERVQAGGPARSESEAPGAGQPCMEGGRDAQATQGQLQRGDLRSSAGLGEANGSEGRLHHGASLGDGDDVRLPAHENGGCGSPRSQPVKQRPCESSPVPDECGSQARGAWPICPRCGKPDIPSGLGTALKPAFEPIILARKPLDGTVAQNVLKYGTGALNIDGCRIKSDTRPLIGSDRRSGANGTYGDGLGGSKALGSTSLGRWPANVLHDGHPDVVAEFPSEAGGQGRASGPTLEQPMTAGVAFGARRGTDRPAPFHGDTGSAARFFYCPKADREDRNWGCEGLEEKPLLWSSGAQSPGTFQAEGTRRASENNHPTVKPHDLMRWLCRLITPPGGLILDPFTGSGSTGRAAIAEGFRFEGIELEPDYARIAEARIRASQPGLAL